jgi:hypothetical protein
MVMSLGRACSNSLVIASKATDRVARAKWLGYGLRIRTDNGSHQPTSRNGAWHSLRSTSTVCGLRVNLTARQSHPRHRTEIATPLWLLTPPTETTRGKSPIGTLLGTWALTCITPATRPGASP